MTTPDDRNNPWDSAWAWLMAYPIKRLNLRLSRNPRSWIGKNAANCITVGRGIVTTILFIGLMAAEPTRRNGWLLALFFAQLSDGADGALARGTHTTSEIGSILDGVVDKYSAVLLLGGMFYWIYPALDGAQPAVCLVCMVLIGIGEYLAIRANKDRMALYRNMAGEKFSSRRPAQIKFAASMLILGSCWLITDQSIAATTFFYGLFVITLLTIWSALDYMNDVRELRMGRVGS